MKKFALAAAAALIIAGAQFAPATAQASTVEPNNVAVFPAAEEIVNPADGWKLDAEPTIQILAATVSDLTENSADALPAAMHQDFYGARHVQAQLKNGHTYRLTVTFRAKGGPITTIAQTNVADSLTGGPVEVGTEGGDEIGTRPIVIDDTTLVSDDDEIGFPDMEKDDTEIGYRDMGIDGDPGILWG